MVAFCCLHVSSLSCESYGREPIGEELALPNGKVQCVGQVWKLHRHTMARIARYL